MMIEESKVIEGSAGRNISLDIRYDNAAVKQACVVFCHGIKGFKDWGIWDLLADAFASASLQESSESADPKGLAFLKLNYSHNGTTPSEMSDIVDAEAFAENRHSYELADVCRVVDALHDGDLMPLDRWSGEIYLIGHSRGGPIVIAAAAELDVISGVLCWASVDKLSYAWRDDEKLEQWKDDGEFLVRNSRTGDSYPIRYSLYEDYLLHQSRLDTEQAAAKMNCPCLCVHGTADDAVPWSSSKKIVDWCKQGELALIEGAGHTFGGKHPWTSPDLPAHAAQLAEVSIDWIRGLQLKK